MWFLILAVTLTKDAELKMPSQDIISWALNRKDKTSEKIPQDHFVIIIVKKSSSFRPAENQGGGSLSFAV